MGTDKFPDCVEERRSVQRETAVIREYARRTSRITQIYSTRMNSVNALHYSDDKGAMTM